MHIRQLELSEVVRSEARVTYETERANRLHLGDEAVDLEEKESCLAPHAEG